MFSILDCCRCGLSNLIYVIILQYLVGSVIVGIAWALYQWFYFNPFRDNVEDGMVDWIFVQQMAEIIPYDMFQVVCDILRIRPMKF